MSNRNSKLKKVKKKTDYQSIAKRGRGNGTMHDPTTKCSECRFCSSVNGVRICHGGKETRFIPMNITGCYSGEKRINYVKREI